MEVLSGSTTTFGDLLRRSRKRAGMTQEDLAAATGYSRSLIAALESNLRLPDVQAVIGAYIPALGLQEEPRLAVQLVERAALARGERPPASLSLELERRPVSTPRAATETYHLPAPPTDILGRNPEIDQLSNRLLGHQGRLLTLMGPPGVGKTRLALAVGAACQAFYRDGACFVPLAPVSDPASVAPALLTALRVLDGSPRPPAARLIEHLRRKELLLVLDNFEQLLAVASTDAVSPAVTLVADLLAECPELHLIVTSRERLHLRAEQRHLVHPLALADAVRLFVARSRDVQSDFRLTDANRPTVEAICEQVDRLRLAIELCAAQTDVLGPAQLLAHLRGHRLDLLADGAQDLPPRQRTLRNTISHSYNLLDDDERRLLRCLGVFAGGCDLDVLAAVSAWDEEAAARPLLPTLHALVGKSLVRAETRPDGAERYLLLETIREFALEQACAAGEEERLRERHFAAYLQLFRTADAHLRGPESAAWLARLEPEQDNLAATLQWTLDRGRYADTGWLLLATAWSWYQVGRWEEVGRWDMQLLPHRAALRIEVRLAIFLHFWAVARAFEGFQTIGPYMDEMRGLLEACPHHILHAAFWHFTGAYAVDEVEANAAAERAIACARAAWDEPGLGPEFGLVDDRVFVLGTALWQHGYNLIEHSRFVRAEPLLAESAAIFRAYGRPWEMGEVLCGWGRLALLQGDLLKARALLEESVTLAEAHNYLEIIALAQPQLALVMLYEGNPTEARRLLDNSLRVCLDLNDESLLALVTAYLAETVLCEGRLTEAGEWLQKSLAYRADPRLIRIDQVERLLVAARLAAAQGDYARAATLFGVAEATRSQIGYEPAGPMRALADAAQEATAAALGAEPYAAAFAAGQMLPLADAFQLLAASQAAGP